LGKLSRTKEKLVGVGKKSFIAEQTNDIRAQSETKLQVRLANTNPPFVPRKHRTHLEELQLQLQWQATNTCVNICCPAIFLPGDWRVPSLDNQSSSLIPI